MDLSGLTGDTTVDLTSSDPEAGTVSDGTGAATFAEIENILLGGGRDTIMLADGSGSDTVQAFDLIDSGDGTTNDQLDVSGLTDADGNAVNVDDVTVSDTIGDGTGDAILTFPNGESITLSGVSAADVSSNAQLEAMGIPGSDLHQDLSQLIYLGNFPELDTDEGVSGYEGSTAPIIGTTLSGSAANANVVSFDYEDADGDGNVESDDTGSGEFLTVNGISAEIDETVMVTVQLTHLDGSTNTATVVGYQLTNGDFYVGDFLDRIDGETVTSLEVVSISDTSNSASVSEYSDGGFYDLDSFTFIDPLDHVVEGTAGSDTIDVNYAGDPEGDRIDNNDHSDGSNNDSITAGGGNDVVVAGAGNDTIDGGTGDDSLTGGTGDDTFIYTAGDGHDTITDFNAGNTGTLNDGDSSNNDYINLSGYYDNIWELHADQADDGVLNQSNDGVDGADYSNNDQFGAGSLTFSGASGDTSSFTSENTGVVCFTSGTAILTPRGEVLIDDLEVGDLVVTMDNGPQAIRWIGRREIGTNALSADPKLRPVLIPKGVMGAERDLLVSRQHALLIDPDHMARAAQLTDVSGLPVRVAHGKKQVTYIHLMFDAHEIIFAENVPAESFYPGPMALEMLDARSKQDLIWTFPVFGGIDNSQITQIFGETVRPFAKTNAIAA